MSTSNLPQLDRIDLSTSSRQTLAVLTTLLAPHVPHSIHILGSILNSGPRASTLHDIDPSKVALWSTIPLDFDAIATDPPTLFSIVTFSHSYRQFSVFCSSESSLSTNPPTKVEKTHVKHVFEYIRDMARAARPAYDADIFPRGSTPGAHPPMIVINAVHPKWAEVLAPMSLAQSPNLRYAFPNEAIVGDDSDVELRTTLRAKVSGETEVLGLEVTEIRASDLSFVHGASTVPRSDAYLLSRAPYSVCLRIRGDTVRSTDRGSEPGRPVACALVHADGSIGGLRVDPKYQRRGLGMRTLRALAEKLNFSQGQADLGVSSDNYRDLGGGALGWCWMDAGTHNEVGNRFLTSVFGKKSGRLYHWTYVQID